MADRMGSKYLQQLLNTELHEHIRKKLPVLKSQVKAQNADAKKQLEEMYYFGSAENDWKRVHLARLLQQFSEELKIDLQGHSINMQLGGKHTGGAKIKKCFYIDVCKILQAPVIEESDVCMLLENLEGFNDNVFPSGEAFQIAVKKLVERYKDPMIQVVDLVSSILSNSISQCSAKLSEYPNLKEVVIDHLSTRLKIQEDETKRHMSLYVDAQGSYVNTKHPEFKRIRRPSTQTKKSTKIHLTETKAQNQLSVKPIEKKEPPTPQADSREDSSDSSEYEETEPTPVPLSNGSRFNFDEETREGSGMILYMIHSYMFIMDKSIRDIVPKYIVFFLIQPILEYTKFTLIADVIKNDTVKLMEECPEKTSRKEKLVETYEITQNTMQLLDKMSCS